MQFLLQLAADAPRPRFGTEETDTQFEVLGLDVTTLLNDLGQVQSIGWRTAQTGGTQVLHEHNLLLRVAGRGWQLHSATFDDTVVHTQSAREETITVCHLDYVARTDVANCQDAGNAFCPIVQIRLRVSTNDRFARRTRRGMDAANLTLRNSL